MIKLPPQVNKTLTMLETYGHSGYIVGGCVRDSLLCLNPDDYDITTSALPKEIEKVFEEEKVIETGIKHGSITVIIEDMPIEITTYRIEGNYRDHRHPDFVRFTNRLEDDLSRRDFTINALAYNPNSGIVDCFNGKADIEAGIIRCVGDGNLRFNEDALRILRALRFSSVLGFHIEDNTKSAAFNNKDLLKTVSSERVYSELIKLLCGKNVRQVIMSYAKIIAVVIPELLPMIDFDQQNPHHLYDLLEHTARVVENTPPNPILRLAALFHDIGKPASFTIDSCGVGHFHGHGKKGEILAYEILTRLKIDKYTKEQVVKLVSCHDDYISCSHKSVRRAMNRLTPPLFFMLLDLKRADNLAQNIAEFNHLQEYAELEKLGKQILAEEQCFTLKSLAIKGKDMLELGMKDRQVGQMLELALDAVIDGKVQNSREALIEFVKEQPLYHS